MATGEYLRWAVSFMNDQVLADGVVLDMEKRHGTFTDLVVHSDRGGTYTQLISRTKCWVNVELLLQYFTKETVLIMRWPNRDMDTWKTGPSFPHVSPPTKSKLKLTAWHTTLTKNDRSGTERKWPRLSTEVIFFYPLRKTAILIQWVIGWSSRFRNGWTIVQGSVSTTGNRMRLSPPSWRKKRGIKS